MKKENISKKRKKGVDILLKFDLPDVAPWDKSHPRYFLVYTYWFDNYSVWVVFFSVVAAKRRNKKLTNQKYTTNL